MNTTVRLFLLEIGLLSEDFKIIVIVDHIWPYILTKNALIKKAILL